MSADDVYFWANWILVAALLIGVAATYAIVVSGNIRDKVLKQDLATQGMIASQANERAAILEKEAADAKLEQERLKAQLAWRTLSPDAAVGLERSLAVKPGSVNIEYVSGDPEALAFAIQLANIFGKAKWKVAMNGLTYSGVVIFGLWIPDPPTPEKTLIRDAFIAIGGAFNTKTLPLAGMTISMGGAIPNAPIVFVGSKAPPQ